MYALFDCHYDHYEFKGLIMVSKDKVKLIQKCIQKNPGRAIATNEKQHDFAAEEGLSHFYIEGILEI